MVIHNWGAATALIRDKAEAGFSFANLVFVVADTIDVFDVELTKVSARIKHFQRLGVPARRPGRGSKTPYSIQELIEVALALQFVQAGMDPSVIVNLLRSVHGPTLLKTASNGFGEHLEKMRSGGDPSPPTSFLWFEPSLSTNCWFKGGDPRLPFPLYFGDRAELFRYLHFIGFERLTIIDLYSFSRGVFCGIARLLDLWKVFSGNDPKA